MSSSYSSSERSNLLNGRPSVAGYSESDRAWAAAAPKIANEEEAKRMGLAADVERVLGNRFGGMVYENLQAAYDPRTFARMALETGIRASLNVMLETVEEAALPIWGDGARYWLAGADGVEVQDDRFTRLMSVMRLDSLAQYLAVRGFVHPGMLVLPVIEHDKDAGRRWFTWRIHAPHAFSLVENSSCTAWRGFRLYWNRDDKWKTRCMLVWEAQQWTLYTRMSDAQQWQFDETGPNAYGAPPGWFFSPNPFGLWGDHYGAVLLECTLAANEAQTLLSHNAGAQVKMIAGNFDPQEVPAKQVASHGGLLMSGNGGAQVVDLTTDVAGFRANYVEAEVMRARRALGLPPVEEAGGNGAPPSGEALKMRYWNRDRRALIRRAYLVEGMRRLYEVALQVLAVEVERKFDDDGEALPPVDGFGSRADLPPYTEHTPGEPAKPQEYRLGIDVNEVTYPELATERQERERYELEMGMTNPAEMYAARNPDVAGVGAAVARVAENRRIAAKMKVAGVVNPVRIGMPTPDKSGGVP